MPREILEIIDNFIEIREPLGIKYWLYRQTNDEIMRDTRVRLINKELLLNINKIIKTKSKKK